jgi:S1-C subfamily serine protease
MAALLMAILAVQPQDDLAKRILDRVERELRDSNAKLLEDVRRMIREEIAKGSSKPDKVAAVKKRAYLGLSPDTFTDEERKKLGIGGGIKIAEVRGPAEKAGLLPGDILLAIGVVEVTEDTIGRALERLSPGDEVEVTVLRERKRLTFKVTLGERKD